MTTSENFKTTPEAIVAAAAACMQVKNTWDDPEHIAAYMLAAAAPYLTPSLDVATIEPVLRAFISSELDYDIHKQFEHDEEDGSDRYPALAAKFVQLYKESLRK